VYSTQNYCFLDFFHRPVFQGMETRRFGRFRPSEDGKRSSYRNVVFLFPRIPDDGKSKKKNNYSVNPYGPSPCVTSSLTRGCICLLWIGLAFVKSTHRMYSRILNIFRFTIYKNPLSVQDLQGRTCLYYLLYATMAAYSVTWTVVSLTTAKFKHPTFSVSGFALSYSENEERTSPI
jgi:hypothetical protein